MVDRLGLGTEEMELRLGASFTNPKECGFHTLRFDFKPASVDTNKMATIDVGTNSQITVTFPPNLIFKGSSKSYQKHAVAIVDSETGVVTLEKLNCNISVKKTRSENKAMSAQNMHMLDQYILGQKPKKTISNKGSKMSNSSSSTSMNDSNKSAKEGNKTKTESQSNVKNLLPIHSAKNSPNSQARFSSGLSASNASPSKAALDDQVPMDDWFNPRDNGRSNPVKHEVKKSTPKEVSDIKLPGRLDDEVGELSDSSSSGGSSSGSESSDSSSDSESSPAKKKVCRNGRFTKGSPDPEALLKEDLRLSESGSDSD